MKKKNLSKVARTLLYIAISLTSIIILLATYGYGYMMGAVTGAYKVGGIEYICNVTNGYLQSDEYCSLGGAITHPEPIYKHHFDCVWGNFTVLSNHQYNSINFVDPRLWFVQCKRTKVQKVGK